MSLEKTIQDKARELGYEKCGIVRVADLDEYDERLTERIEKVPASKAFYQNQSRLTRLSERYPWAKSAVVTASRYGHYAIPASLEGRIGKHYLFDGRVNAESQEYQRSVALDRFLKNMGLQTATNRNFGIVGLRWAAMKAGLGVVRRNNFFYTESGSWVELEAWLTDRDMELVETAQLPACPQGCSNCIRACPTGSLCSAYTMNPASCVSYLTTFGGRDLPNEPLAKRFGSWIYGCDACQDACPMNRNKWTRQDEFPGISEIEERLTPQAILAMDEETYRQHIQPRFFYLSPDDLWKWKVNALNYMRNCYQPSDRSCLLQACRDENEKVRDMAQTVCRELALADPGQAPV